MVRVRQSDGRNARHATICVRALRHAAQMRAGKIDGAWRLTQWADRFPTCRGSA